MPTSVPTDRIDVAPFLASGLSVTVVARRLGWVYGGKADTTRLTRALGMAPKGARRGEARYTCRRIGYDAAVQIVRALDLDPIDFGL